MSSENDTIIEIENMVIRYSYMYIRQIFIKYNNESLKRIRLDIKFSYNSGKKALTALAAISKKVAGSTQITITIIPEMAIPRPRAGP